MKLNSSIIGFYLFKKYSLQSSYSLNSSLEINGIRHYVDGLCTQNCLIIIEANKLSSIGKDLCDNLFISIGKPNTSLDTLPFSLITIEDTVVREELFNDLQQIFELMTEWDLQLDNISKNSRNFQSLLDCCEDILADPIALINNQFRYVAYNKDLSHERGYVNSLHDNDYLTINTVNQLLITPGYKELEQLKTVFIFMDDNHFIAKNIFYEDQYVGRLIVMYTNDLIRDQYNSAIISHISLYVELMYEQYGSFYLETSDINKFHEMVESSLTNHLIPDDNWIPVLDKLGWKISDDYMLIQFQPKYRYDKTMYAEYLCPQIERIWKNSCVLFIDERVIMLFNSTRSDSDFHKELIDFLRDSLLIAGISRKFHGFSQMKLNYLQTTFALEIGVKQNPSFWCFKFDNYAFDCLLEKGIGDFKVEQICCNSLLLLKNHDKQMNTQYYLTLYTYFKHQYNAVAAAKDLFIHRSTFMNRMDRIKELTTIDLNNWNTLLYLMLSFHIIESSSDFTL